MTKSELDTFCGKDNRKEIMRLLFRLGNGVVGDKRRANFLLSLIPLSLKGFKDAPIKVEGNCDAVAAYFMLVSVCNEIGVSINVAASRLEKEVKRLS